jgi:hypothetical protein
MKLESLSGSEKKISKELPVLQDEQEVGVKEEEKIESEEEFPVSDEK